jgi:hypothetical protein
MRGSTNGGLLRIATVALVTAFVAVAANDRAGATPARRITVQGAVLGPSDVGIILLPDVLVTASDGAGITSAGGLFGFTATFTGFPFEVHASIDGVPVRILATTFAREDVVSVIIDLGFEAGVQILEAIGLERFTLAGIEAVLSAVFNRNANTDYSGLAISQAIALARRIAQDDPVVQRTIAQAMIEPGDLCGGDCDGGGTVTVNELVTIVNIALGRRPTGDCPSITVGTDVDVSFLLKAIRNALLGCLQAIGA